MCNTLKPEELLHFEYQSTRTVDFEIRLLKSLVDHSNPSCIFSIMELVKEAVSNDQRSYFLKRQQMLTKTNHHRPSSRTRHFPALCLLSTPANELHPALDLSPAGILPHI